MNTSLIVAILAASAALSALYAEILRRRPQWYRYNGRTWVTVVLGGIFILATLAVCWAFGLITLDAIGLVILVTSAWGAPIIVWQLSQSSAERAIYESRARRKNNHDEDSRR